MKKYGLIGKSDDYLYLKIIQDFLINKYNLEASYELIEATSINKELLSQYDGLNITSFYQENVLTYLNNNEEDLTCNTIVKKDDSLFGYNTEYYGFEHLITKIGILRIKKVVVLGDEKFLGIIKKYFKSVEVIVVSSNDYYMLKNIKADLLINTIPIVNYEFVSPIKSKHLINYRGVIDLNYIPINSKLALDCAKYDIAFVSGFDMLIKQAIKSFEMWHNIKISVFDYKELKQYVLSKTRDKIALIGLSLNNKSDIIKKYNGVDLDLEIEKRYNESKAMMLENNTFEFRENLVLSDLITNNHKLIALGSSVILNHENMVLLKDYLIIHLNIDINILIERLCSNPKPLIENVDRLIVINEQRFRLIKKYSNLELNQKEIEVFLNETSNNKWS